MDKLIETMYNVITEDMFLSEIPPSLENLISQIVSYEERINEEVQSQRHARDIYAYRYLMAIRMELARLRSLLTKD